MEYILKETKLYICDVLQPAKCLKFVLVIKIVFFVHKKILLGPFQVFSNEGLYYILKINCLIACFLI